MLVSVDLRQTITKPTDKPADKCVVSLFALLSFGYMLPWVTIGSLIKYFADEYGDSYFVILNVAFYAVGYPVSYIQRRVDLYYDTIYGSKKTFRRRIEICMVALLGIVLVLPALKGYIYVAAVTVIGIFTWTAHGASSSLASVVKNNSNIVQQIGFALPGVFALVMSAAYHLSTDSSRTEFTTFYVITGAFVFLGLVAWLILGRSDVVRVLLEAKDDSVKLRIHNTILDRRSKRNLNKDSDLTSADVASSTNSLGHRQSGGSDFSGNITLSPYAENINHSEAQHQQTSMRNPLLDETQFYNDALVQALFEDPKLLSEALQSPELKSLLKLHMRTLFVTIYCSILQGSFLAYTPSSEGDSSVVVVVFYARLFMDLFGRPLALLPRPGCFKTIEWLFFWSILRAGMMVFYFAYIALPEGDFFRNDWFIIIFQSVFSILSGYFNALTFEYAANVFPEEWKRFQGAQVLSVTFQKACLAAVLTAAAIIVVLKAVETD